MKIIVSGDESIPILHLDHVAFRITKPEESIKFYEEVFNLKLIDKYEDKESKFTIFFLGGIPPHHVIELIWNWEEIEINKSRQLSHIAFQVKNISSILDVALKNYGTLLESPHLKSPQHKRCYIEDPNGIAIELNEIIR
ncbi:VOC family protein [Acinetobacter sp. ACIN00229]|uniref:VOC family protein n=1 Tax=Acinetobacter sp. ACIN00229 TaxID=2792607 RepID=UPI0018DF64A3|nr:VOC family protein [Acinetobacter sp. ACIN00229]MBI0421297.1 VOC family protein [Acinetobacter sp. ACIN00229]